MRVDTFSSDLVKAGSSPGTGSEGSKVENSGLVELLVGKQLERWCVAIRKTLIRYLGDYGDLLRHSQRGC